MPNAFHKPKQFLRCVGVYASIALVLHSLGCAAGDSDHSASPSVAIESVEPAKSELPNQTGKSDFGLDSTAELVDEKSKIGSSQTDLLRPVSNDNPATAVNLTQAHTAPSWSEPIRENEDYFRPPTTKQVTAVLPSADRENHFDQDSVRLLGFVQVDSDSAQGALQAILRIEGQMLYLGVGDTVNEIDVIDISPPSVTLQCQRHRWDISLNQQPSVPKDTRLNSTYRIRPQDHVSRSVKNAKNSKSNSQKRSSPAPVPPSPSELTERSLPVAPLMPEISDLPAGLQLPELPELPDISGSLPK